MGRLVGLDEKECLHMMKKIDWGPLMEVDRGLTDLCVETESLENSSSFAMCGFDFQQRFKSTCLSQSWETHLRTKIKKHFLC